jgi:hypothetical protein
MHKDAHMDREDVGVKLNLRLDDSMAEARRSVRSRNGEIIWRLRQSLERVGEGGR